MSHSSASSKLSTDSRSADEQRLRAKWASLFYFTSRRHIAPLILALAFSVACGLTVPLLAWILGRLFNAFSNFASHSISAGQLLSDTSLECTYFLAIGSGIWFLDCVYFSLWVIFGELQAKNARKWAFEELLHKDMQWFDGVPDGLPAVLPRIQAYIRDLQLATSQPLGATVYNLTASIVALVLAMYISWSLTLVCLASVPICAIIIAVFSSKIQPKITSQQAELTRASKIVTTAISSIDVVKHFNGLETEAEKYKAAIGVAAGWYYKEALYSASQIGLISLLTFGMFVQGFWYGSYLVGKAGDTTFVAGKSGSGKSTIGNLLMGFYAPTFGEVYIDDRLIQTLDVNWIRNNITLVQQESILFNESILKNITFGSQDAENITARDISAATKLAGLQDTILSFPLGLDTIVGTGGSSLSGGQRQRVALARARLRDTPILILDESTSAIDYSGRIHLMNSIRAWRQGKTTIIITHDLSQIRSQDFVYVVDQGRIAQQGYKHVLEKQAAGIFDLSHLVTLPPTSTSPPIWTPKATSPPLERRRGSGFSSVENRVAERRSLPTPLSPFFHRSISVERAYAEADQTGRLRPTTVMTLIGFIWGVAVCWKLALVGAATAPPLYGLTRLYEKISGFWENRSNQASETMAGLFTETFLDIRTVRSLTLESYFHTKHDRANYKTLTIGIKRGCYSGLFFGFSECSILFVYALVFYYGAVLVSSSQYSAKDILMVFSMLLFSMANVKGVLALVPQISSSKDSATRVLQLVNMQDDQSHEHQGSLRIPDPAPLNFSGVDFSYPNRPEKRILKNFNLTIPSGSCTAIVGPSGSGKSTVSSLLLALYPSPPSQSNKGTVTLGGVNIRNIHVPTLRSLICIVPQDPTLFPASIKDNITYGLAESSPLNTMENIQAAATAAGIHDFISSLPSGYGTLVGDGGIGVSGGQAQRIVIARALVRRPRVLILDEATSSLDVESATVIRQTVAKLMASGRRLTVIIITHAREMMELADNVVVVDGGTVVEEGPFADLSSRSGGRLRRLLRMQL
ncbi:ABC a-pheromone efflux pump AtrD [Arthroderma uncinatum]|uniref:ABC a-pheromone efflux pump AtrD n=1 Tax=Arthroderma uncinatum TaxID=74035 RepID=UPI00144A8994|nr:ABC a-pheromone efflux pump AtrD [Arthroderma uncinatum]KAF3480864.1 ABC a-pheromone efflux pump AtrD [Arthroderma uncinatum]